MTQADTIQQLMMLCHTMQQTGLQPSVGLLRSKAPFKISVTQAIEAIKLFNASNKPVVAKANDNADDRIRHLEKRVAAMEAAMAILEQRLNNASEV